MGFQYYHRHEWWRDDQRTYRPRKKASERDYFYKVAKDHGFDAIPSHFQFSDSDIIGTGTKVSDWMLRIDTNVEIYSDQQVMAEVFTGFRRTLVYCKYSKLDTYATMFGRVYVLKSDYDWAIQERDCDIEDLI